MKRREYTLIASAYARAMFGAAQRLGLLDEVQREARAVLEVIERTPKLLVFWESPRIPTEDKLGLVRRAFEGRLSAPMRTLLELLVRRDRTQHLLPILTLLDEMIDRSRGIYPAQLASGRPLTADDRRRLTEVLERRTGHRLRIEWLVEPALIGGVLFQLEDLLIDGTLRRGLDEIRSRLREASILRADHPTA